MSSTAITLVPTVMKMKFKRDAAVIAYLVCNQHGLASGFTPSDQTIAMAVMTAISPTERVELEQWAKNLLGDETKGPDGIKAMVGDILKSFREMIAFGASEASLPLVFVEGQGGQEKNVRRQKEGREDFLELMDGVIVDTHEQAKPDGRLVYKWQEQRKLVDERQITPSGFTSNKGRLEIGEMRSTTNKDVSSDPTLVRVSVTEPSPHCENIEER